jgi:hypothetical protein
MAVRVVAAPNVVLSVTPRASRSAFVAPGEGIAVHTLAELPIFGSVTGATPHGHVFLWVREGEVTVAGGARETETAVH